MSNDKAFRVDKNEIFQKNITEQVQKIIESLPQQFNLGLIGVKALTICNSSAKILKYYELLKRKYTKQIEKDAICKLDQFIEAKMQEGTKEEDFKDELNAYWRVMNKKIESREVVIRPTTELMGKNEKLPDKFRGKRDINEFKPNINVPQPSYFNFINNGNAKNLESYAGVLVAIKRVWEESLALQIFEDNAENRRDLEFTKLRYLIACEKTNCNDVGRQEQLKNLQHDLNKLDLEIAKVEKLRLLEKMTKGEELDTEDLEWKHQKAIQKAKDDIRRKEELKQAKIKSEYEAKQKYRNELEDEIEEILDNRDEEECKPYELREINRLRELLYNLDN